VQSSFFVVYDFASQVADGVAAVESLVPLGQHGHGWEPGPGINRDAFGADAFVYVGEGFQPWADRVVGNIAEDGAEVAVVEAWADVDLLEIGEHHGDDDDHDDDDHDDEGHGDHGHGAMDPHFWLDPRRAAQSVETIAHGLSGVDPPNADAYTRNAESYVERLRALDETYRTRLADRTNGTVLVAGHDSFQYLARRYGFDVEALVGISPDAAPTPADVARAQAVVEEHDVEYVLTPVFESDRAARQLVAETDATGVLPLTPVPGITGDWHEAGWGFVEVMERVNLPSLERALGAV
jgi:zinc transport system substrate-binding protein